MSVAFVVPRARKGKRTRATWWRAVAAVTCLRARVSIDVLAQREGLRKGWEVRENAAADQERKSAEAA